MGNEAVICLVLLVFLLLIGVEILAILGVGAIFLTLTSEQFPMANISLTMFDSLNLFPLTALPLFILTGDIVARGGIAAQIMDFARATVGWLRGGMALTTLVAAAFFAAISGSNAATVATMGRIAIPEMKKDDAFPAHYAAATVAAGGTVGIIIPPSIMFVLYGVTVGVSVSDLFIAGILPGLVMVLFMGIAAYIVCRRKGYGKKTKFTIANFVKSFWGTKYAIGAIVFMLGGIYAGIFTPTEAGALAALYCLLIGLFVNKKMTLRDMPAVLQRSASITGLVAPVIALAVVFSQNLAVLRIPELLVDSILSLSTDPTMVTLLLLGLLLLIGCFMETAPNILLLAPILAPFAVDLGFHPVHFGVVMTCALAIGFITPPLGINLFVASAISGEPVSRISLSVVPYLISLICALLLITFWPALSLSFIDTAAGIRLW